MLELILDYFQKNWIVCAGNEIYEQIETTEEIKQLIESGHVRSIEFDIKRKEITFYIIENNKYFIHI